MITAVKIIGSVIITAATTAVGISSAGQLKNRVRSFSTLIAGLDLMRSEICTRLTPIPELLELLVRESGEPAKTFFMACLIKQKKMRGRPFSEVWRAALLESEELELKEAELQPLLDLGNALGRYDTERQAEAIAATRKRMETFLSKAESERDREGKTRAMLGIAAGAAIVIILL